ncbi:ppGpp synthetase catalytic domain-containing protein (RelA/SpoT-type nucleotidyltranferase) [Chitinophaga sp. YR573]|uniref:GTP pyrophosphokinase n=1 Tax=Chitinophaga sp. YR573 TaxID=1881040 RepID=UPI0008B828BA|nr:hypothetical protein [Chitinophaga sp. YR573]SEW00533.1 ppGpp synthetase catalytic domain-containing protein (RelA/SpoT-type nucleotidyltranferase) [Chitinophaga sp. YR573]
MIDSEELKSSYPEKYKQYDELGKLLVQAISKILQDENIKVHAIYHRAKDLDSLIGKIASKDNKYSTLEEITDLSGLRVITYLESDVEKVEKILRTHLIIDESNSVDKRRKEANEFGYKSLHLVSTLQENWLSNPIYKSCRGLKSEIQIRSILQHAWAEIEHDLGYKSTEPVPYDLKRGFNRLAAGLESADIEFDRLVKLKEEYKKKINYELTTTTTTKPPTKLKIPIDSLSLSVLIDENPAIQEAQQILTQEFGIKLIGTIDLRYTISKLKYLGIEDIQILNDLLIQKKEPLKNFTRLLYKRRGDKRQFLLKQSPLDYFLHYLASARDRQYLDEYITYGSEGNNGKVKEVTDFIKLHNDADNGLEV